HMTPRHCALFLLSRRPPASTLFPYTTLFRSKLAVLPDDPTAPGRIAVDVICHEFHPLKGKRLHLLEAAFFFFFSAGFISSKPRIKSSRSLAGVWARRMTLPFLNFFICHSSCDSSSRSE